MFEQNLYDEIADIHQRKLQASKDLGELLRRVSQTDLHEPIARLHANAQRNVLLAQRLVEIVS